MTMKTKTRQHIDEEIPMDDGWIYSTNTWCLSSDNYDSALQQIEEPTVTNNVHTKKTQKMRARSRYYPKWGWQNDFWT